MAKIMNWIDDRFPLTETFEYHMSKYYAPKNFNFWYYFGSLALLMLVLQIFTGIFLTMHYKPDTGLAFASVEYIMRDVEYGWLIRYMHSVGASFFFIAVYLHMYRGLIYGSYRRPRELLWIIGVIIFIALMAESFMGYLLPWGNMSYWGAQVIVSLFDAIPMIGPGLAEWIRGDFVVGDATLTRFFAFHVAAVPLVLIVLVFLHLVALHHVGSNNPDGIEIKDNKDANGIPKDGIAFHPYYTVKDIVAVVVFMMLYSAVIFFAPDLGGIFLERDNFIPANFMQTPPEIVPLWYFTPFYSILRAGTDSMMWKLSIMMVVVGGFTLIYARHMMVKVAAFVVPAIFILGFFTLQPKLWGVIMMFSALVVLFFLSWLDKSPVKSIRYRGWIFKLALILFIVAFGILGYLGMKPPTALSTIVAQVSTLIYFLFFLMMPFYTRWDKTKPVPERVTS